MIEVPLYCRTPPRGRRVPDNTMPTSTHERCDFIRTGMQFKYLVTEGV